MKILESGDVKQRGKGGYVWLCGEMGLQGSRIVETYAPAAARGISMMGVERRALVVDVNAVRAVPPQVHSTPQIDVRARQVNLLVSERCTSGHLGIPDEPKRSTR